LEILRSAVQQVERSICVFNFKDTPEEGRMCPATMTENRMITIGIVEDEKGARESFHRMIEMASGFRLLGIYSSREAVQRLRERPPQVALLDLRLANGSGAKLVRAVKAAVPSAQLLVFGGEGDNSMVVSALKAGACGYIVTLPPAEQLLNVIKNISEGGAALCSRATRKLVEYFQENAESSAEISALSDRQREILELASRGRHNKDIATELRISTETVRVHLRHVYVKLGVSSRSQAVAKYITWTT
jgi:DNA-binding NarL/FixJ family response regulator